MDGLIEDSQISMTFECNGCISGLKALPLDDFIKDVNNHGKSTGRRLEVPSATVRESVLLLSKEVYR